MIGDPLRPVRIVAKRFRKVSVVARISDAVEVREQARVDQFVVEHLRVAVEAKRVPLIGRNGVKQIDEVGIHQIDTREHYFASGSRRALDVEQITCE